eukprot:13363602-Alexandrium_andersonii.AAC.1
MAGNNDDAGSVVTFAFTDKEAKAVEVVDSPGAAAVPPEAQAGAAGEKKEQGRGGAGKNGGRGSSVGSGKPAKGKAQEQQSTTCEFCDAEKLGKSRFCS